MCRWGRRDLRLQKVAGATLMLRWKARERDQAGTTRPFDEEESTFYRAGSGKRDPALQMTEGAIVDAKEESATSDTLGEAGTTDSE